MRLSKVKIALIILSIIFVAIILISLIFVVNGYKYKKIAVNYSKEYGVDSSVILAIIQTESGFKSNAYSSKGAIGLMQIMPETANYISEIKGGVYFDLKNPDTNVNFGVYYYKYLLDKFKNEDIAICAYNAGESNAFKWFEKGFDIKNIKYSETLNYYKKVKFFKKIYGIIGYGR